MPRQLTGPNLEKKCQPQSKFERYQHLRDDQSIRGSQVALRKSVVSKLPKYPSLTRWQLLERIEKGCFSDSYRARDLENVHGEVVIKVMKKNKMTSQQKAQVQREIGIICQVIHTNIVRFVDTIETPQFVNTIMEFCAGGTLLSQIVKRVEFNEDMCRKVIIQLAHAIEYLHYDLGVMHRDIKLENIFVFPRSLEPRKNQSLEPLLADYVSEKDKHAGRSTFDQFGIVKLGNFGSSQIISSSESDTPRSTLEYAAPEMLNKQQYSPAVDMWSIGCVLFTLLGGYPPFYDPDREVLASKILKAEFEFKSPSWEKVSGMAKDLISKLFTAHPSERYDIEDLFSHPWTRKNLEQSTLGDFHISSPILIMPHKNTLC